MVGRCAIVTKGVVEGAPCYSEGWERCAIVTHGSSWGKGRCAMVTQSVVGGAPSLLRELGEARHSHS